MSVQANAIDTSGLRGRLFLIVEDVPAIAEIMSQMIRMAGGRSVVAANGRAGVEAFAATRPGSVSCILMDIRMPELDGYGAAREIRALERADAKTVPIVAMTAYASEEDVSQVRVSGMDAYFVKPVRFSEFVQTAVSAMRKDVPPEDRPSPAGNAGKRGPVRDGGV